MGQVENLTANDAVKKIREIAKDANICMFVTKLTKLPLAGRPMATQEVDDEGNIWFMSDKNSNKDYEIKKDDRVQLFYSHTGNYEYLSIFGRAELINDKKRSKNCGLLWQKPGSKMGKTILISN